MTTTNRFGLPLVIPAELTGLWAPEAATADLNFGIVSRVESTGVPVVTLEVADEEQGLSMCTITRP
jgi:hypothetical protein